MPLRSEQIVHERIPRNCAFECRKRDESPTYVLGSRAPEDLPKSYREERHPAATKTSDVTNATMRLLLPRRRAALDGDRLSEVDSDRPAEPSWHVGSPLTTPDPARPRPVRPPRGVSQYLRPALAPDVAVPAGRLRAVRSGFLLLTDLALPSARGLAVLPVRFPSDLAEALGAKPGEIWIDRVAARVAAVLSTPDDLPAAWRRLVAGGLLATADDGRLEVVVVVELHGQLELVARVALLFVRESVPHGGHGRLRSPGDLPDQFMEAKYR